MFDTLKKLNAFELHKLVMHRLNKSIPNTKTDLDVIRENHRFLWEENGPEPDSWEEQLAKKYYSKLFHEYCICDLTRYKENKIALRWRTEAEVVAGKGQFICSSKHCTETVELRSWEVNFNYLEAGEKKSALVKVRLCVSCSKKLNYHSTKRLVKKQKRLGHTKSDIKREESSSSNRKSEDSVKSPVKKEEQLSDGEDSEAVRKPVAESSGESLWSEKVTVEERSREEEFGDYLEDLLL